MVIVKVSRLFIVYSGIITDCSFACQSDKLFCELKMFIDKRVLDEYKSIFFMYKYFMFSYLQMLLTKMVSYQQFA